MPVALPRPAVQTSLPPPPFGGGHPPGAARTKTCPSPTFDARSLRNGTARFFIFVDPFRLPSQNILTVRLSSGEQAKTISFRMQSGAREIF